MQYCKNMGYALPAILIISTALMIVASAILQNSVAARQSLTSEYFNRVAREAGEAGVAYSEGCILKASTSWSDASPLTPGTNCAGASAGGSANITTAGTWSSTFAVNALSRRQDGATVTTSTGTVTLANGRKYSQTVKKNVNGTGFVQLTAKQIINGGFGGYHVSLLGSDNQLYGVGANGSGELGNGTFTDQSSLVKFQLPNGLTVKKLGFTGYGVGMTSVIASDNQVYSTGSNGSGSLGTGDTASKNIPTKFILPNGLTAREVIPNGYGSDDIFVLASDNQVYGAGINQVGQLGSGATSSVTSTPVRFSLPGSLTARSIVSGGDNTYVLASDNNVYAAGRNDIGQLGVGDVTNRSTPTKVILPNSLTAVSIAASYHDAGHFYVLASDNQVYGAGYNGDGRLGNNSTANTPTPVKFILPNGLTAVRMLPGPGHLCVVASDYQMYCAGHNLYGQLGNGTTSNTILPTRFQLPTGRTVRQITTDIEQNENSSNTLMQYSVFVVTDDGQVYGAGKNDMGQMGNGTTQSSAPYAQTTPVRFNLPTGVIAQRLTAGTDSTYVVASDAKVYAAGQNNSYQLGDGTTTNRSSPVNFKLPYVPITTRTAQKVFNYSNMVQVLSSDNQVYAAGANSNGQMGINNTTSPQSTPVRFQLPAGLYATDMTGTDNSRQVVANDGQVYFAGTGSFGQSGSGVMQTSFNTPVKFNIPAGVSVVKVVHGIQCVMVLGSDGNAYIAGQNTKGQLGDGTTTNNATPQRFNIPTGIRVRDIIKSDGTSSNTFSGSYVVSADGRVWSAGDSYYGQTGTGKTLTDYVLTPTAMTLPSGTTVRKLVTTSHGSNVFIVASDNQIYGYGRNQYGQLGNGGTSTTNTTPVKFVLPGSLTARDVAQSGFTTYVLASDNNIYAAGYNSHGQVGNGGTSNVSTPVKVNLPSGITAVKMISNQTSGTTGSGSVTYSTMYILGSDNQFYAFGINGDGQLGQGNNTATTSVVKVSLPGSLTAFDGSGGSASSSSTGASTFSILASDYNVYSVGDNGYGQIGDTTTTDRYSATSLNIPAPTLQSISSFKF